LIDEFMDLFMSIAFLAGLLNLHAGVNVPAGVLNLHAGVNVPTGALNMHGRISLLVQGYSIYMTGAHYIIL
jgi:hypothetical protein